MDESIALVELSKSGRRACVKTFEYAHIEVGSKIWFPRRHLGDADARPLDDAADCGFWGAAGRRHVLRVATYAFATRHAARLRGLFDRVVFDEAHCLRNEKTRRHAALLDVARHAPVVHCLTGTPVVNASTDVLSLFRVLGYGGPRPAVWNSNLQPDFNVRVYDSFDASSSAVLREIDESNRFVQKSAESTSI